MLTWKIAWRNLWRHRGKSLVIGTILFLGALLMTVGNAMIKGSRQELQENLVDRLTGHLILVNGQEDTQSLFFDGRALPLKLIPDYPGLKQILDEQEIIEQVLPMNRGKAMLLNDDGAPASMEEEADESGITLFGVEFEAYQEIFRHNVIAVEGALLKKGEQGILLAEKVRKKIYDQHPFNLLRNIQ